MTTHKPLVVLALAMGLTAIAMLLFAIVDPQIITGQNGWLKPLKFSISIAIYAITLSWLISQLTVLRRAAHVAGTIAAAALAVEMVIIVGAAATQTTSHFNVSTPFQTTLWSVMAGSIVVVWVMTLVVAFALFRNPDADPARRFAIRAGAVLALIGMALAFLMTFPTESQLQDFEGIAGAHAVGVDDGGPGLPLVGWSTEGGDLRIPHFVGMHALQALPLTALFLEFLATRLPFLRSASTRLRLLQVIAIAFSAFLAILTWQALIGQSIVRPAGGVLSAGIAVGVVAVAAVIVIVARARRGQFDRALAEVGAS